MKQYFFLNKELPACHVSKNLIKNIEEYLSNTASQSDKYSLQCYIHDEWGFQKFSSISDYIPLIFSDKTRMIIIRFEIDQTLEAKIRFSKTNLFSFSEYSAFEITAKTKEAAIGIYIGLLDIMSFSQKQPSFYFLYSPFLQGSSVGIIFGGFIYLLVSGSKDITVDIIAPLTIIFLSILFLLTPLVMPHTSFDTKQVQKYTAWSQRIINGLFGFFLVTFLTYLLKRLALWL